MKQIFLLYLSFFGTVISDDSYVSYTPKVACNDDYIPENCGYPNITLENMITGEDFKRCGPAVLPKAARNYYWGVAGRGRTYENNLEGLRRAYIIPRILNDVSKNDLRTTVLGTQIELPIGVSPAAALQFAHADGEVGEAKAAASVGAVMVVSSSSSYLIEDVAKAAFSVNEGAVLWMQTYLLKDRDENLNLLRRAEKAGFKAVVVTVDNPIASILSCDSRSLLEGVSAPNLFDGVSARNKIDASATFKDLALLVRSINLPVVAKGVMTGTDAVRAAEAGVSAILVSNHGARQLDSERATIDVLPEIVMALKDRFPKVEVYMDGGIKNGWDVFKALARGARAAFAGSLPVWGLAIAGEEGARKTLTILRSEFNESMIVAGYANPRQIYNDATSPEASINVSANTQW